MLRPQDLEIKTLQSALSSQRRHTADVRASLLVREDDMRRGAALSSVKVARAQARVSALERRLTRNTETARLREDLDQAKANEAALLDAVREHEAELSSLRTAHAKREAELERQVCVLSFLSAMWLGSCLLVCCLVWMRPRVCVCFVCTLVLLFRFVCLCLCCFTVAQC